MSLTMPTEAATHQPSDLFAKPLRDLQDAMQHQLTAMPKAPVIDACRYHLSTGGGLMRARLGLVSASLTLSPANALNAAMACEWLHNASLIHDDISDGELLRRGQPTVCEHFGPGIALCAGDLMLTLAFAATTNIDHTAIARRIQKALTKHTQRVISAQSHELALTAKPQPVSFSTYVSASAQKTAPFIELSLSLGVAPEDPLAATVHRLAQALGLAYQILDDLDDVLDPLQSASSFHPLHAIHHHHRAQPTDLITLACRRALRHALAALKRAETLSHQLQNPLRHELNLLCQALYEHHHQVHRLCIQTSQKAIQST